MKRSAIEWTDFSGGNANFVRRGKNDCAISPGCDNCYARRIGERFGNLPDTTTFYPDKFDRLLHTAYPHDGNRRGAHKRPMVFVCDTGDWLHPSIEAWQATTMVRVLGKRTDVTWQLLTKRATRLPEIAHMVGVGDWPANVWCGVTAENQEQADRRIPLLLQVPAAVRFVSVEPMIGPVDLSKWLWRCECGATPDDANWRWTGERWEHSHGYPVGHVPAQPSGQIQWVICGGETGPGARPIEAAWVESLYAECKAARVSFFLKSMGDHWRRNKAADPILPGVAWPQEFPIGRQP